MTKLLNQRLFSPLLIGGIALILIGISGGFAVMARGSTSAEVTGEAFALDRLPVMASTDGQTNPEREDDGVRIRVNCEECGVVESTRRIQDPCKEIDPVALGNAERKGGNEIPCKSPRSHKVTVRMSDGSSRVFMDATAVNWRPGERIIIIGGTNPLGD